MSKRSEASNVAREKHSPVYHSMSRGGCQGKWGKSGEAREGEQRQVEAKAVREAREGGGWRGGIGIKKLVMTTPYRAQK